MASGGSRSLVFWGLFWAVGILHFWIRPIPKKLIFASIILMLLFLYFYGIYKVAGLDVLQSFESGEAHTEVVEDTGRTLEYLLLNDLGRAAGQSFLLYRLSSPESDYEYAWGRTYLGGVAQLIPSAIWPGRPPPKNKEGTEAQFGMGSYVPGRAFSGRAWGLAGEAMLNFGPVAVPFAYLVFGLLVGRVRRLMITLDPADSRRIVLPLLISVCVAMLTWDSNNIVWLFFAECMLIYSALALSSTREVVAQSNKTEEFAH